MPLWFNCVFRFIEGSKPTLIAKLNNPEGKERADVLPSACAPPGMASRPVFIGNIRFAKSPRGLMMARMNPHVAPVELGKAIRLINHGPTTLVSAHHAGVDNVMAAAWVCALDYTPPKLTATIDGETATRRLIEASGRFVIQVPTVAQLQLTHAVGSTSLNEAPDKLARCGVELFRIDGHPEPFVAGCAAWLLCRVIPEPHNQETYDLFIGEIIGAWADSRVFRNGRWQFEEAGPAWRTIHHVAGGQFYAIGEGMKP